MSAQGIKPWSRRKLLVVGALMAVVALALLAGLVLAVTRALRDSASENTSHLGPQASMPASADRDELLMRPMLSVAESDALGGEPATTPAPAITVPDSMRTGPARVVTGFPRTPEGAVGQLAAIEQAVLGEMNVARVREVHSAWALTGAVTPSEWPLMQDVQSFLGSAGMGSSLDVGAHVEPVPVAAQVKATDGPDWTVACVLLDVHATVRGEARMAYGYCEAMQWHDGRWMIASHRPAAPAPSTWPGTELARRAGWLTWHVAGE